MKFTAAALALLAGTALGTAARADEGTVALGGVPKLSHVFVIMMENHGYNEIIGNPDMPWLNNTLLPQANLATNYFAVAHPSLTNYLETIGGSNFGINNDNSPIWGGNLAGGPTCTSTLTANTDENSSVNNCPIAGTGMDAATAQYDCTNEVAGDPKNPATTCDVNVDGSTKHVFPGASTAGKSIGDQLNAMNMTWKTYQESLPLSGAWGVTTSDGQFTDNGVYTTDEINAGQTAGKIGKLYRAKHNPFEYFASVEQTYDPTTGKMAGIASYEGIDGLWADLATGKVPNYSFIVPNQCHDQHGGTSSGLSYPFCAGDSPTGTQASTNPGLMQAGDYALQSVVTAIQASPAWKKGRNAIVILWDENDYSQNGYTNQVPAIVVKNYGTAGKTSSRFYTHFSLLRTIEAGFGLPCLNHACDTTTQTMSDLFNYN